MQFEHVVGERDEEKLLPHVVQTPEQKAAQSTNEAGGEWRGAYFLYTSTLDAGIAKGSAEGHRPTGRAGRAA
ncbi:MAG: hypothetical protein ABTD50_19465 [Polyangiaceae bacterium]